MTTTYNITHNAKFDSYEVTFESKPATVKPTTPDDEPTKPAKDEPKEAPAAEETAPVQPAEQAQENAKDPRYQVIVNDDRYGGLDEKLDYNRITDARKAMHGYVNEEDWESAAIYDRKSGEIVETYGEYFPVDQINVRTKAQESESVVETVVKSAEEPATIYKIDDNGHDVIVKCVGDDCYTVEYCEDGKRLGEVEENCTADYIDFKYGILVNPEQNTQNQPEPTPEAEPAETITESAGVIPEEAPETAGFHPIINNLPKKSKWDVWNVHPDEYLSSCVVPLVRCDENYHVLDTVYLKVDTPEEVKTLMSAAAVGNRRRWPKYSKQYRRETVQRAADIIEKYYI